MDVKGCIKFIYKEVVYFVVLIVYLIRLNLLNKELLTEYVYEDSLELLVYREYLPLKYFAVAVLLTIVAVILIMRKIRLLRQESSEFAEVILSIVLIVFLVISIVLIIQFINHPILRAIVVVASSLCGVGYVMSQN